MIKEVLTHMAVCHTVVKDADRTNLGVYNGASPDEIALVHAANRLGVEFVQKDSKNTITLNIYG